MGIAQRSTSINAPLFAAQILFTLVDPDPAVALYSSKTKSIAILIGHPAAAPAHATRPPLRIRANASDRSIRPGRELNASLKPSTLYPIPYIIYADLIPRGGCCRTGA